MGTDVATLTYNSCDLLAETLSVTLTPLSGAPSLPRPEWYVYLDGAWEKVSALPDGCPVPLPPGTACAITLDLSAIIDDVEEHGIEAVRGGWPGTSYNSVTATCSCGG